MLPALPNQQLFSLDGLYHGPTFPQNPQFQNAPADPNSPEAWKFDIQLALQHSTRVQTLAQEIIERMRNAYAPGMSSSQTAAKVSELQQAIDSFNEFLRQSPVGSLPILKSGDQARSLSQEELLKVATKSVAVLYERLERSQESANVVASLLAPSSVSASSSSMTDAAAPSNRR